jgi:hypothetical protein
VVRPQRELVGFQRVWVPAGESVTVEVPVTRDDLAYYDTRVGGWVVETGDYLVYVGASSRDLRTAASVTIQGDDVKVPITADSPIAEALQDPSRGPDCARRSAGSSAVRATTCSKSSARSRSPESPASPALTSHPSSLKRFSRQVNDTVVRVKR